MEKTTENQQESPAGSIRRNRTYVGFDLLPETKDALLRLARQRKRSLAFVLREAAEQYTAAKD
jgi:predicted transcriptional regulator